MARASASTVRKRIEELRKETGWGNAELVGLLRQRGGGGSKGATWERDFCKLLGEWWCGRDDVFWRAAASGARAAQRAATGAATYGQHGDIAATDPAGAPLVDTFCIELKRGYNEHTIMDCIDRAPNAKAQEFEAHLQQTIDAQEVSGVPYWLLVTSRTRRVPVVWLPDNARRALIRVGAWAGGRPIPWVSLDMEIRGFGRRRFHCTTLNNWWDGVTPAHILELAATI